MLHRVSIRAQLFLLAVVVSLLMIGIGWMGLRNTSRVNEALREVYAQRVQPMRYLKNASNIYVLETGEILSHVMAGQIQPDAAIAQIDDAVNRARVQWTMFRQDTRELTQSESQSMAELEALMARMDNALDELKAAISQQADLAGSAQGGPLFSVVTQRFYPVLGALSTEISRQLDIQLALVKQAYDENSDAYRSYIHVAWWSIGIGVFIAFFLCWGMARSLLYSLNFIGSRLEEMTAGKADLTQRIVVLRDDEIGKVSTHFNSFLGNLQRLVSGVQRSGIQVTSAATSIAATSTQLEQTVNDFGSFTNQVGATAKEISATSQELVGTMNEVSSVATNTAELASQGQGSLGRMEQTMSQMENASEQISARLAIISEKAANITTVVTTITKIADQTNLLSLNASIEAEKAGEYGLGFAVVAREIRRLADQVAMATLDIEQMVSEMKSAVSAGVMEMDKFTDEVRKDVDDVKSIGSQLAQIIHQVQALLPRFESVHQGVQAQAEGAHQISDSMVQLSSAVEDTSESLSASNQVVKELEQAAKGLQKEVAGFRVDSIEAVIEE